MDRPLFVRFGRNATEGEIEVTLTRGQTFYEGFNDIHVVGRKASNTKPAKFLVVLAKKKSTPVLVPVQ